MTRLTYANKCLYILIVMLCTYQWVQQWYMVKVYNKNKNHTHIRITYVCIPSIAGTINDVLMLSM